MGCERWKVIGVCSQSLITDLDLEKSGRNGMITWLVVWNIFYFSIYWDFSESKWEPRADCGNL